MINLYHYINLTQYKHIEGYMKRTYIVQSLINQICAKTYLEIGVFKGENFFNIKAPRKIAIDPNFKFSKKRKIKYALKNPANLFLNRYYETASDDFFTNTPEEIDTHGIDIAFIDGLHTYEQSLRDVQNCLKYLNPNGFIILHDCNPATEAAAFPCKSLAEFIKLDLPRKDNSWNGDVWKTILYLRSMHHDLNVFVVDTDHGIGVVYKSRPESMLHFTPTQIEKLSYKDLEQNRDLFLNLKNTSYITSFINTLDAVKTANSI